jgi:hypothetical protein
MACAVDSNGGVKCWGTMGSQRVPVPTSVAGLTSGITAVSVGYGFACAIAVGGAVQCWGDGVGVELGPGVTIPSTPVQVPSLASGVSILSVGAVDGIDGTACAVTAGGGLMCWGENLGGTLGSAFDGSASPTPVPVAGLAGGVTAVSVGIRRTVCAIASGNVECWGRVQGTLNNYATPTTLRLP